MTLYIHIPFCDSKCGYCGFFSKVDKSHLVESYFQALRVDLCYQLDCYNVDSIDSVFFGGGTPNSVFYGYYEEIFYALARYITPNCEITLEANPNLLTKDWLLALKDIGINRLSLGVQSFFNDKLHLLERNHNTKEAKKAIESACHYMDNVSIDLIYDCKLDNEARILQEIQQATNFNISHISMYSLSIDNDSAFARESRFDTQSSASFRELVRQALHESHFYQYEVSNFYRSKKCRHNLSYWHGHEYLGVGAGSVGRVGNTRYYAIKNIESYISNPIKRNIENLSKEDLDIESIFLGFRSEVGVCSRILDSRKILAVCDGGLCEEKDSRIYAKDLFNADNLASYFV